jgi:predicted RNA-binding protein with RPS1 domain
MQPGDIVIAKVTNIVGYGAFVEVNGYDGLIHISEFSDNFVKNITDFVKIGDEIRLRVLEVDDEHKRVKLSYKQLHKTRGVKCKVPEYKVDFKTLGDNIDGWIEKYQGLNEDKSNNGDK